MTSTATRVVAVTVAHRSDWLRLQDQLRALLAQVGGVIVVENGASEALAGQLAQLARHDLGPDPGLVHVPLGRNAGLAVAQNAGIAMARQQGATHVLLMDDDSVPQAGMVSALLAVLQTYSDAGAAGPWYADPRQPKAASPFVRIDGLRLRRLPCLPGGLPMQVDHLIASGCLIPVQVLDDVGPMREDFFIDFIDVEWSLRARHAGYALYGVCDARLEHRLGRTPQQWLGRSFLSHPPWRLYYQVRNAWLIYRQPWVPLNWKLVSLWRLCLKVGFRVLVGPHRVLQARRAMQGWADALSKRRRFAPRPE